MKIVNLLEGSEKLYHLTGGVGFRKIVQSGGLLCSVMNSIESGVVGKKLGISGKLFYLSMARSVMSSYIQNMVCGGGEYILFEIDGRKLGRYGRVLPISFFSAGRMDEMEDRLIGDRGRIDLGSGVITGVRVLGGVDGSVYSEFSKYGIPMKFYDDEGRFLSGRGGISYEEKFGGGGGKLVDDGGWAKGRGVEFVGEILRWLDGGEVRDVDAFVKSCKVIEFRVDEMLRDVMRYDYGLVRRLYMKLRGIGVSAEHREDFFYGMLMAVRAGRSFDISLVNKGYGV